MAFVRLPTTAKASCTVFLKPVSHGYDVVRLGEILEIHDCPRHGYDITILVLRSHWIRWVCDASGQSIGCQETDIIVGSTDTVV